VNAGQLDRLLLIEARLPDAQSPSGEPVEAYASLGEAWANYRPITGSEQMRGGAESARELAMFTIRYDDRLKPEDRVTDQTNGTVWDILTAQEYGGRREWTQLTCQRFRT
jgi:SPP1 family predicted phage head-tail adaptor